MECAGRIRSRTSSLATRPLPELGPQPYLAGLFYKAYLSLEFAPQDPELDRRMAAAAEKLRH